MAGKGVLLIDADEIGREKTKRRFEESGDRVVSEEVTCDEGVDCLSPTRRRQVDLVVLHLGITLNFRLTEVAPALRSLKEALGDHPAYVIATSGEVPYLRAAYDHADRVYLLRDRLMIPIWSYRKVGDRTIGEMLYDECTQERPPADVGILEVVKGYLELPEVRQFLDFLRRWDGQSLLPIEELLWQLEFFKSGHMTGEKWRLYDQAHGCLERMHDLHAGGLFGDARRARDQMLGVLTRFVEA